MLQEVEKEVVLLDQNLDENSTEPLSSEPPSIDMDSFEIAPDPTAALEMAMDAHAPPPVDRSLATKNGHRVLKVIKKVEVQILCTQHNPVRKHLILSLILRLIFL